MIYGLYLSAQGAQAQQRRLEVIANNIANASTVSFKRDLAIFQHHEPHDKAHGNGGATPDHLNESTGGLTLAGIATDFSTASVRPTDGNLDIALSGPGFLKVSDGKGKFLTRDGRLSIDKDGSLVTPSGHHVLDILGNPIETFPNGGRINISSSGEISQTSATDTIQVGQLALVEPQSYNDLQKVGNNLYENSGRDKPAGPDLKLKQGFVEWSGVEPIHEMMELIQSSRAFEANTKMIKYQDEALGQLLNTVPRL